MRGIDERPHANHPVRQLALLYESMFTYRIRKKASAKEEPEEYIGLGEAILTGRTLEEPYEVVSTLAGRKLVMYDSEEFPPKKRNEEASE